MVTVAFEMCARARKRRVAIAIAFKPPKITATGRGITSRDPAAAVGPLACTVSASPLLVALSWHFRIRWPSPCFYTTTLLFYSFSHLFFYVLGALSLSTSQTAANSSFLVCSMPLAQPLPSSAAVLVYSAASSLASAKPMPCAAVSRTPKRTV